MIEPKDTKFIKQFVKFSSKAHEICETLGSDNLTNEFAVSASKLHGLVFDIYNTLLPFKVGDKVKLSKDFVLDKDANGWYPYRDTLVPGSCGTIADVDYYSGGFVFYVLFKVASSKSYTEKVCTFDKPKDMLFAFRIKDLEIVVKKEESK